MLPSNIDRVQRHSSPNNHKEEVLMKVSMNDIIKVKLNKIGDELLQKVFGNSQELPKKDPDGYTEMKFISLRCSRISNIWVRSTSRLMAMLS